VNCRVQKRRLLSCVSFEIDTLLIYNANSGLILRIDNAKIDILELFRNWLFWNYSRMSILETAIIFIQILELSIPRIEN
jgi:hypothetical protein